MSTCHPVSMSSCYHSCYHVGITSFYSVTMSSLHHVIVSSWLFVIVSSCRQFIICVFVPCCQLLVSFGSFWQLYIKSWKLLAISNNLLPQQLKVGVKQLHFTMHGCLTLEFNVSNWSRLFHVGRDQITWKLKSNFFWKVHARNNFSCTGSITAP